MSSAEQDETTGTAMQEKIILGDVAIDVSGDDQTVLVDTICDLVTEAETWRAPAIALWASRSNGRSNVLRQLRRRLEGWDFDTPYYHTLRLVPNGIDQPGSPRRDLPARLTRAWAWRRIGANSRRQPGYDIVPGPYGSAVACTVVADIGACKTLDDVRSCLARAILGTVSERLPRYQSERLWFDLNLRRTDPSKMRRRILASYLPQSLGGALAAALVAFVAVVVIGRGLLTPRTGTLSIPDLIAFAGVAATVIGYIVQAKSGRSETVVGLAASRALRGPSPSGLLDDAGSGADPYLIAWEQDLVDVLFLAGDHTKIVLMIDDLDRSSPEIVAGVLESVRVLPHVILVAAFDPALVAGQLEQRTPWLAGRVQEDPVAYGRFGRLGWIDLIEEFDISIQLPAPPRTRLARQVHALSERRELIPQVTPVEQSADPESHPAARPADSDPIIAGLDLTGLQAHPLVAQVFTEVLQTTTGSSHHRTLVLINTWRFYATVEHRCGRLRPPYEARARAIAFFAQLLLGWPWLLGGLASNAGAPTVLSALAEACEDDQRWQHNLDDLHIDGEAVTGLRVLLRRCGEDRNLLLELAERHL